MAEVWIPAVPLPWLGAWTDSCRCGKKFRGKNRRAAYELHWRLEHESQALQDPQWPQAGMPRAEAERIYGEVRAERRRRRER